MEVQSDELHEVAGGPSLEVMVISEKLPCLRVFPDEGFSIQPSTALSPTSILLGFTIFGDTMFLVGILEYKVTHSRAQPYRSGHS